MTNSAALEVAHLYKVFGKKPLEAARRLSEGASRDDVSKLGTAAVIDASFTVNTGEIFVVMGLSGSGKSTLIRTLNGLLEPTIGDVSIMGTSIGNASKAQLRDVRRTRVSMVFQHFALLPHRTVLENIGYGLEIQRVPLAARRSRAWEILDLVGLTGWGDKLPEQLSGGMQQHVGLGRALAADTDVLLMDEAFSALDPLIRREMQEQLLELQSQLGKTIVFITHDLNEAMFLTSTSSLRLPQLLVVITPSPAEVRSTTSQPDENKYALPGERVLRQRYRRVSAHEVESGFYSAITRGGTNLIEHIVCVSVDDSRDPEIGHKVPLGLCRFHNDYRRLGQQLQELYGVLTQPACPDNEDTRPRHKRRKGFLDRAIRGEGCVS